MFEWAYIRGHFEVSWIRMETSNPRFLRVFESFCKMGAYTKFSERLGGHIFVVGLYTCITICTALQYAKSQNV